jgi:hypothetical protein
MRKFFLFFLLLISIPILKAQDQPSSLQIKMWDNSLFAAVFGSDDNGRYQRTYNVRSLAGGEYYLKIMKHGFKGPETIFEGQIEIPPASRVQAILLQSGGLEISVLEDTQKPASSFDFKSKVEEIQQAKKPKSTELVDKNRKIEPLEFADLRNNMAKAVTDQDRNSVGVEGLNKNTFTTSYIVQLARLFRNETSRLEFAKSAYTRVIDPENYFQVKLLFTKKENAESLQTYMDQKADQTISTPKLQF